MPDSDRELLEAAWRTYDAEFADHVGDVVAPYEYVDTEEQVDWTARVFMFGYALGSVAGAHAAAPDAVDAESDAERVVGIVDRVIDVHRSDEFAVTSGRVREDLLD